MDPGLPARDTPGSDGSSWYAGISIDDVVRLEQGRTRTRSAQVCASLISPAPGSDARSRLDLLATVGTQAMGTAST